MDGGQGRVPKKQNDRFGSLAHAKDVKYDFEMARISIMLGITDQFKAIVVWGVWVPDKELPEDGK